MKHMSQAELYIDAGVSFTVGASALRAVLTLPATKGPCPAIVLLHGSDRSGVDSPFYRTHAEKLVQSGVAVLRYDGPGWGGQTGAGFETLEYRAEEALAAVHYLQSRPGIVPDKVGLWGFSQGGWICQMAAATSADVAFIIPVSGPGISPAEQEVFRVEAESRAANYDQLQVAKAVLLRRLMVDVVMPEPLYQMLNQAESRRLGGGPWDAVMELTYRSAPIEPSLELKTVIELFRAIQGERWTKYLHLNQVLSLIEQLTPQMWEATNGQMAAMMNMDPADYLMQVRCPVLAIFGAADTSLPVEESIGRYRHYLSQANNSSVTIRIFPAADHGIHVDGEFAPGYFDAINTWLSDLITGQAEVSA